MAASSTQSARWITKYTRRIAKLSHYRRPIAVPIQPTLWITRLFRQSWITSVHAGLRRSRGGAGGEIGAVPTSSGARCVSLQPRKEATQAAQSAFSRPVGRRSTRTDRPDYGKAPRQRQQDQVQTHDHAKTSSQSGSRRARSGKAAATAAVRLETSSRRNVFSRCFLTVLSARWSRRAICVLLRPASTRCSSSH